MQVENTEPLQENSTQPTTETPAQSQAVIDTMVKHDFDFENETAEQENEALAAISLQQLATAYSNSEPDYSKPLENPISPIENPKKAVKSKKKATKTTKLPPTPPIESPKKVNNRFSGMINFTGERGKIVTEIIEQGIAEGYWHTKQHFYDKVFDFAINSQLVHQHLRVTDAYIFGVPDGVETKLFTNGYYENDSKLKLDVCK